jgi:hypothetical protein
MNVEKEEQKQTILYTGAILGNLDAREFVRKSGGLPKHILLDHILTVSNYWRELERQGYFPAWSREFYVHPERYGRFKKGTDVVDAIKDIQGRTWKLPASSIPLEAFDAEKPSLLVDPGNEPERIKISKKEVIIADPASVILITPSIQVGGQLGEVDEKTGFPLDIPFEQKEELLEERKRYLLRKDGPGVSTILRDTNRDCDDASGVGYESLGQVDLSMFKKRAEAVITLGLEIEGLTKTDAQKILNLAKLEQDLMFSKMSKTELERSVYTRMLIDALKLRE